MNNRLALYALINGIIVTLILFLWQGFGNLASISYAIPSLLMIVCVALITGIFIAEYFTNILHNKAKIFILLSAAVLSFSASSIYIAKVLNYYHSYLYISPSWLLISLALPCFIVLFLQGVGLALSFNKIPIKFSSLSHCFELVLSLSVMLVLSMLILFYHNTSWLLAFSMGLLIVAAVLNIKVITQDIVSISIIAACLLLFYGANVQGQIAINAQAKDHFALNRIAKSLQNMQLGGSEDIDFSSFLQTILFESLGLHGKKILVVGSNNYQLAKLDGNDNYFTFVDTNGQANNLSACHYMDMIMNGDVVYKGPMESAIFFNKRYDVVISQASQIMNTKNAFNEYHYFTKLQNALNLNGIAIIKLPSKVEHGQLIANVVTKVFPKCIHMNIKNQQMIYICSRSENYARK